MANSRAVFLLLVALFYADGSLARQILDNCANGPEYWCKSFKHAVECGAVELCGAAWRPEQRADADDFDNIDNTKNSDNSDLLVRTELEVGEDLVDDETVVLRRPEPRVPGIACELCMTILNDVHLVFSDSRTQTSIEHVVEIVCNFMPIKSMCKTMAPEIVIAFIKYVDTAMIPEQVCQTLQLCPGSAPRTAPLTPVPTCPMCLFAAEQVQALLKENQTRSEIHETCTLLPPQLKRDCEHFMDELVEAIDANMSPQEVCHYLHLCKDSTIRSNPLSLTGSVDPQPENSVDVVQQSDVFCEICMTIVSDVHLVISNPQTEEIALNLLDFACNILPTKSLCKSLVAEYVPTFIEVLKILIVPKNVCGLLMVCSEPPRAVAEDSLRCEICQIAERLIVNLLKHHMTQAQISKALPTLCSPLPAHEKEECKQVIDMVVEAFVAHVDPEKICHHIHICSSNTLSLSISEVPEVDFMDAPQL